jgi:glycosyltransferase involved in cell wall biosynthesis
MTHLKRVAFIGNSLPRQCGIATFTTHLQQAVAQSYPETDTCIVAMTDHLNMYAYPAAVRFEINDSTIEEYAAAAGFLNAGKYDVVCLQHEFGIFGGESGTYILALLSRLTMPVITTLHTVLANPTPGQRSVLLQIIALSAKIVVMAEKGRELLRSVYHVPEDKIDVVAHGIPDFGFVEPEAEKHRFGYSGRQVILTFGLLTPNKGIEVMIDAMPEILKSSPDCIYIVLGATHPNLVRHEGEAYREKLIARAEILGVDKNVVFLDQFVDQKTLLGFISLCDVYVTPYLTEGQMTSGTLAYSFGLGKPVVSTPYWHAHELLADGLGILVPFGDAPALGSAIAALLTDDDRRLAMRKRAYDHSRSMTWDRTAVKYMTLFENARQKYPLRIIARQSAPILPRQHKLQLPLQVDVPLEHFISMCDDTGLFQHAVHSVPDRLHGYCVDDNARALLVSCSLGQPGEKPLPDRMTACFASFIQHAWNPDTRRFRNFMSFDRRWLEDRGSEDSHGRTLWALGECVRSDTSPSRQRWAAGLFEDALPTVDSMHSPRTWAFTLLGLEGFCEARTGDDLVIAQRHRLATKLVTLLDSTATAEWRWFEGGLAYDNARLCQALIVTGMATNTPAYTDAGLRSLKWLMALQTAPSGCFRPVGSDTFGDMGFPVRIFDQQPLEATASISACLAAWRADGDSFWQSEAARSFAWFSGSNDLLVPLVDMATGSCRDGLHADRANENRGGESVVSYLLSLSEIRQHIRQIEDQPKFAPRLA